MCALNPELLRPGGWRERRSLSGQLREAAAGGGRCARAHPCNGRACLRRPRAATTVARHDAAGDAARTPPSAPPPARVKQSARSPPSGRRREAGHRLDADGAQELAIEGPSGRYMVGAPSQLRLYLLPRSSAGLASLTPTFALGESSTTTLSSVHIYCLRRRLSLSVLRCNTPRPGSLCSHTVRAFHLSAATLCRFALPTPSLKADLPFPGLTLPSLVSSVPATMRSTLAIALFAFAGWSVTQTTTQQSYPYTIEPDSVKKSDRRELPAICNVSDEKTDALQSTGVTSKRRSARSSASNNPALPPRTPLPTTVMPYVTLTLLRAPGPWCWMVWAGTCGCPFLSRTQSHWDAAAMFAEVLTCSGRIRWSTAVSATMACLRTSPSTPRPCHTLSAQNGATSA